MNLYNKSLKDIAIRLVLIPMALLFALVSLKYCDKLEADNKIFDSYHSVRSLPVLRDWLGGKKYEPKSTLIVALDNASLDLFRDTPIAFFGPKFARVIDQIINNGARLVVLDFQFFITPDQWLNSLRFDESVITSLNYDGFFDKKLSEGRVILGAKLTESNESCAEPERQKCEKQPMPSGDMNRFVLSALKLDDLTLEPKAAKAGKFYEVADPPLEYLESLSGHRNGIGLATLISDKDSVIRKFIISSDDINIKLLPANSIYEAPNPWLTLSALAVEKSFGREYIDNNQFSDDKIIYYCGPPGTIPSISFASFFRKDGINDKEKELIKNKIVFIGVTDHRFYDKQATPYSKMFSFRSHPDMNGIEIHANIVETLLRGKTLEYLPFGKTIIFVWLPFMILTLLSSEWCEDIKRKGSAGLLLTIVELVPAIIFEILPAIITWIIGFVLFYYCDILLRQAILFATIGYYLFFVKSLRFVCKVRNSKRRV